MRRKIVITPREMHKARKAIKGRIPASERPWQRPAVFTSKKVYTRKGQATA